MRSILAKLFSLSKRWPFMYPVFLACRLPVVMPQLIINEGFFGAFRWMRNRFSYVLQNRNRLNSAGFFNRPIKPFHSRFGFDLFCLIEYVIYDEIFLDRAYEFLQLRELLGRQPEDCVMVDFGTHHGMFISFFQTIKPRAKIYGAELSSATFANATKRFDGQKNVSLLNVGIAGCAREISIQLSSCSTEQSIYGGEAKGEQTVKAQLVTAADFVKMASLEGRAIALLKMDIEGAEKEVFENFETISGLLRSTSLIIMEIHSPDYLPLVRGRLEPLGFQLMDSRGINFFFAKSSLLK